LPHVSRRAFLAASAAAATISLLPTRRMHAAVKPVGLQLYSVREQLPKDYSGTLAKIAAIGYRDVEAAGFYGHSAAEVKQIMAATGLHCVSAHYSLADLLKAPDATLDYASTLGLSYVICSSPSLADPSKAANYPGGAWAYIHNAATADDWKWNADQFNQFGEKFQARHIRFGYHNHVAEFRDLGNGFTGYDILLKNTDPRLVTFELDCGWAIAAGQDAAKLIREHSARITMLHLKDFAAANGAAPDHRTPTPIGYGVIDFKPIVAAAADGEIAHAFIEQEAYSLPPFEELKVDYDNMNTLASGGTISK
jgi:sugar phosphate isomerase/epimerase